jgi:hypothetical protein
MPWPVANSNIKSVFRVAVLRLVLMVLGSHMGYGEDGKGVVGEVSSVPHAN